MIKLRKRYVRQVELIRKLFTESLIAGTGQLSRTGSTVIAVSGQPVTEAVKKSGTAEDYLFVSYLG